MKKAYPMPIAFSVDLNLFRLLKLFNLYIIYPRVCPCCTATTNNIIFHSNVYNVIINSLIANVTYMVTFQLRFIIFQPMTMFMHSLRMKISCIARLNWEMWSIQTEMMQLVFNDDSACVVDVGVGIRVCIFTLMFVEDKK